MGQAHLSRTQERRPPAEETGVIDPSYGEREGRVVSTPRSVRSPATECSWVASQGLLAREVREDRGRGGGRAWSCRRRAAR